MWYWSTVQIRPTRRLKYPANSVLVGAVTNDCRGGRVQTVPLTGMDLGPLPEGMFPPAGSVEPESTGASNHKPDTFLHFATEAPPV